MRGKVISPLSSPYNPCKHRPVLYVGVLSTYECNVFKIPSPSPRYTILWHIHTRTDTRKLGLWSREFLGMHTRQRRGSPKKTCPRHRSRCMICNNNCVILVCCGFWQRRCAEFVLVECGKNSYRNGQNVLGCKKEHMYI